MLRRKTAFIGCLLLILAAAACIPAVPPDSTPTRPPLLTPNRTQESTASPSITPPVTVTPSPTIAPPDYPYILLPDIQRLQEVFREGRRQGMRRGVFSKVGDSITANGYFLVPFGIGTYSLGGYGYLQEVIAYYLAEEAYEGNSFVHASLAARISWRAEDVLNGMKNWPPCDPKELPLLCEYRIVRPALAVILLGTNDAIAPKGTFAESMQRVVTLSLGSGILPILTTIPELLGKDIGPFNAILRDLADRWKVPLIDLHAALAELPNQGLGPDGVHLSWVEPAVFEPQYLIHGMTVRNLLTLQALDAVWRAYPTA